MAKFYDTHAHLDYPDFQADFESVMDRAQAAGIARVVCIGTDLDSSEAAIRLAERYAPLYAAVGWHPCNALKAPHDLTGPLRQLVKHPKVVAVGETGFDYHHLPSKQAGAAPEAAMGDDARYRERQREIFLQQLEVAADFGLNCVIHQRDALEDTLEVMRSYAGKTRGVFHCFANDAAAMRRIVSMGSLVSFTGIATFKNAQSVRDTLAATPMDAFMLETDCPYLAPAPYRGKRCEPSYVKEISEVAAAVKGCGLDDLSTATCRTAHEFFKKLQ